MDKAEERKKILDNRDKWKSLVIVMLILMSTGWNENGINVNGLEGGGVWTVKWEDSKSFIFKCAKLLNLMVLKLRENVKVFE